MEPYYRAMQKLQESLNLICMLNLMLQKQGFKLEEMSKAYMTWDQQDLVLRLFMFHVCLAQLLKKMMDT